MLFSAILGIVYTVSGRVRVTVRLRPQNADELIADADFGNYVELMPEVCFFCCIELDIHIAYPMRSALKIISRIFPKIEQRTTLFMLQLKRLKLRKNNWDSETFQFDDVLTEFASQKRVYEVVAKPVVEVSPVFFPRQIFGCNTTWLN
mgnify:CR=1 FL=1